MTLTRSIAGPGHRAARFATSALLAVILLAASGVGRWASAQDATPSPEASPTVEPTPLPEGFTRKMANEVADVIKAVHPVRGLPKAEGVIYRIIEPEAFRTELEALFREEYPDDYIAAEDAALTRLGLLAEEDDLAELILSLYDSQVLAYFDPRTTTFSLIGPVKNIGALESLVVAHEYGHALQDAAWDLEGGRVTELDQADAILAQQSLIEGDATKVMYDWAARELRLRDLLVVSAQALVRQDERKLRQVPPILRRQLELPYLDGFAFVNAIHGRGGWEAVNDAWEAPPVSTEQILHPELYPDELPVPIELPDVAGALGTGRTASYEQTLGEMQTHVWVADGGKGRSLFPVLPAVLPKAEAAAGWGGDRLVSLDGPNGEWAVVWQTDWDTRADAREFQDAARAAIRDLPGASRATDDDVAGGLSSPVLVLVADSDGTLDAVTTALGLDS